MENASEALKIAAAVVLFMLALGMAISSFTMATGAVDSITTLKDRETSYTYVEQQIDANGNIIDTRVVSGESIVPIMYKAYEENFKIIFKNSDGSDLVLFEYTDVNHNKYSISSIDLENQIFPNGESAVQVLNYLLGGNFEGDVHDGVDLKGLPCGETYYGTFKVNKNELGLVENKENLYDYFNKHTFIEKLGEYYQEDAEAGKEVEDVLEVNKTKKRVITYILNS